MAKRILVVDDEKMIAEILQHNLESAGFETVSFFNGKDALEYIENNPSSIDLAIIDHKMPGMSGLELAGKLRMMMTGFPIIMVTGYLQDNGFGDYKLLKKPTTKDQLLRAVKGLIS